VHGGPRSGSVASFLRWLFRVCSPSVTTVGQEGGRARGVTFKGAHFAKAIILTCVRGYVASPLSYRQLEEMMQERGGAVDHATVNRWVLKYAPQLAQAFHRRKRPASRR
jgi:hypothetical protein